MWSMVTPSSLVWYSHDMILSPMMIGALGPIKDPLCNRMASHFAECGVREFDIHQTFSWWRALLSSWQASSIESPMQSWVTVTSHSIVAAVSPIVLALGGSRLEGYWISYMCFLWCLFLEQTCLVPRLFLGFSVAGTRDHGEASERKGTREGSTDYISAFPWSLAPTAENPKKRPSTRQLADSSSPE